MEGYCARCNTSLTEMTAEALARGVCPSCGGQVSVGSHSRQLGVAGAIGMTFAAGSNIGEPVDEPFGQRRLGNLEDTAVIVMPKIKQSSPDDPTTATSNGESGSGETGEVPAFSFDLPPFPRGSASEPPAAASRVPLAEDAAPLAGFELPPVFGASGRAPAPQDAVAAAAPAEAPSSESSFAGGGEFDVGAPAGGDAGPGDAAGASGSPESPEATPASDTSAEVPAHLQLPTFDFSLPPLGAARATAAPLPVGAELAGGAGSISPAHLELPNFPQFELPPLPGEERPDSPPAGAADDAGASPPLARAPGGPPPPPRRRSRPAQAAAPALELPSIGLPTLAAESARKEVTLLRAEAADELEEMPPRKRPVLPFLAVAAILAAGAGAWLERDALVGAIAARDPQPVVETAESKALALYAAGQEAYTKHKLDEAAAKYEAALRALPKFAKAHRALGIARAKQNRREEAVEHYRAYLQLEPKAPDAAEVRKIVEDYEKAKSSAAGAGKTAENKRRRRR